jgi:hypothetical protein
MKKLVEVQEVPNEGFISLLGERITVFCMVYIYTGKLTGVNDDCIELEDPSIVYETGPFSEKNWKDAQKLPNKNVYIQKAAIESFGVMK